MENTWYYIVSRTLWKNSQLLVREVGYCESEDDANHFNTDYENTFGTWIKDNIEQLSSGEITVSEYFVNDPIVYSAFSRTKSIEGKNLPLVLPL